jgi:hypothetical protein
MALMEEMEEFALEDIERTLRLIGGQDALLIAIGSVRELEFCRGRDSEWGGGSDGEGGGEGPGGSGGGVRVVDVEG